MGSPRIYISGRMTGLPEYNFPAFNAAAEKLRAAGWEVENPAESFGGATDKPYKEYVAFDIAALKRCDAIWMLPGWDEKEARGSVWEHGLAIDLELDIYYGASCEKMGWLPPPASRSGFLDTTPKPTNPKDAIGSNKLPLHLWPTTATALGCIAMLDGALKYGRSNFRAIGVRATIYVDAAKRHLDAWLEGEECARDNNVPHLGHALACIGIIADAQAAGKLNDDRMVAGGYHQLVETLTPMVAHLRELHAGKTPKHYTIADAGATP